MASISNQPGGRRTIQFIGPDGTRKSIRLGKMPKKAAEAVKLKVEQLVAAAMSGHAVDDETARWVAGLDKVMAEKLAAVEREAANLHDFIDGYITSRRDVKPNTVKIWRQTLRLLIEHFGRDRPLRSIAHGEAKDWRLFLIGRPMADATVRKHCGFAKHFFAEAVDRGLVEKNPFTKIVSSPVGNASRQFFVTREAIQKVIDACPDAEWRLIVALSRFGALRCPSEHLKLRWDDIDWGRSRMTVRSPKTERHEGHESREVPIFPELLPYLEDAFDCADPGAEYVIAKRRNSEGNLRTHLRKIVKRAGLQP